MKRGWSVAKTCTNYSQEESTHTQCVHTYTRNHDTHAHIHTILCTHIIMIHTRTHSYTFHRSQQQQNRRRRWRDIVRDENTKGSTMKTVTDLLIEYDTRQMIKALYLFPLKPEVV